VTYIKENPDAGRHRGSPRTSNDQEASTTRVSGHAAQPLDVAGYLDALGIREDEMVGLYWARGDVEHAIVRPRGEVVANVDAMAASAEYGACNAFLAPNPTAGPSREGTRGREAQVTRVAAVYADIDKKAGACADIEAALDITNAISEHIAEEPTVLIRSGGGLQPLWARSKTARPRWVSRS
jgi:hypothetical protein